MKKNLHAFTPHSFYDKSVSFFGRRYTVLASGFKSVLSKKSAGFTLIEIMIVMVIVSITVAVTIVSLGGNGRIKKDLEINAREFASAVREAQNYSLTGKQLVPDTAPCGFSMVWPTGTGYGMSYMYKNSAGTACDQSVVVATYPLRNGVMFSDSNTFYFKPPWGQIFDSSGTLLTTGSIPVVFTKSSVFYAVCIYADGRILEVPDASTCP